MGNRKKKVLIIDYYRPKSRAKYEKPRGVQEIEDAIRETGNSELLIYS